MEKTNKIHYLDGVKGVGAFSLCFGITLVAVIIISHFSEKYIEKGLSDIIIKKIGNHIFNDGNKLT